MQVRSDPGDLAVAVLEATAEVIASLSLTQTAVDVADRAGVTWASRRLRLHQRALSQMVPALCRLAEDISHEEREPGVEWSVRLTTEDGW
jgi:hypothetical protein